MAKKETIRVPLTFEDIPLSSIGKWDEVDYSDIHLVHLFSNMDKSTLRTLPVKAIEQTAQHLRKILSTPTEEHVQTITIDGVKYGFIKDWKELTAGEYVDIAQYVEEPLRNATKLMSIFYRPIVEEWENGHSIQAYEGTKGHEVFNDVSASYFYGAIGFFLSTMMDSAITSLQYLESLATEIEKPKKKWYERLPLIHFLRGGRGMTS